MAQTLSPFQPETEPPPVPQAQALREYAQYLERERGLSPDWIHRSTRTAGDLLKERFGDKPVLWGHIQARDVTGFLLRRTEHVSSSSAKKVASRLRQFLRYLQRQRAESD